MPKVIVTTDNGDPVWMMDDVEAWHLSALTCPTNRKGSALASGVRRAVQDAETIQKGGDPERPSERAVRLAAEIRADEEASGLYGTGEDDAEVS